MSTDSDICSLDLEGFFFLPGLNFYFLYRNIRALRREVWGAMVYGLLAQLCKGSQERDLRTSDIPVTATRGRVGEHQTAGLLKLTETSMFGLPRIYFFERCLVWPM